MKKLLIILLLFLSCSAFADDTATVQALLTAGTSPWPSGHTYIVSSTLTVTHSANMNGDVVVCTDTSGNVFNITAASVALSNGSITGPWLYTNPANHVNGKNAIRIGAANVTVTGMTISQFSQYGIVVAGAQNNPNVTYNTLAKIGYIAFYFDAEAATTGGNFSYNTVDRSMILPTKVHQLAVGIRGSTTSGVITTGWTISHNVIKMPFLPTDNTSECMEIRYIANSTVSSNIFLKSSISCSVSHGSNITVTNNLIDSVQMEGIEWFGCDHCTSTYNVVKKSFDTGILIDGYLSWTPTVFSSYIYSINDTVRSAVNEAIHLYTNTNHVFVTGDVLSCSTNGVFIQNADNLTLVDTKISGSSAPGSAAIYDAGSPGNVTITGGSLDHYNYAVFAYNTNTGAVVDNILGYNVDLTGTTVQFGSSFSNGAHYGTNHRFTTSLPPSSYGFKGYQALFSH